MLRVYQVGAGFKLNPEQREGYTDFLSTGGPDGYTWNVIRSESDHLMLQHAQKSGAKVYEGVKVKQVVFKSPNPTSDDSAEGSPISSRDRPVSALWSKEQNGTAGTLGFDYIVDASGRAGLLNGYTKSRTYNKGLKNVASWAYWNNAGIYASGTARANSPYFEALSDESGWAWLIPLHDKTTSVGVVMNQEQSTRKKRANPVSTEEFYINSLKLAPNIWKFLEQGDRITEIKHASDYSYSSSSYASQYVRVVGDAGCFIDPYFSSGVHLALVSGLSAATTICAVLRGDCKEQVAAEWHSSKVADCYTRFLLIVTSAYRQIRSQKEFVLSDAGADNIDKAFEHFRPVIQGTADSSAVSHDELGQTIEFCAKAWRSVQPEERTTMLRKMATTCSIESGTEMSHDQYQKSLELMRRSADPEEQRVLDHMLARGMLRVEDSRNFGSFTTDIINGLKPNLERGNLTLSKVVAVTV
ncbi:MAG: hypothetical protein LQ338_006702 [Usnochroma carphineum]|nr:MAG: hypothetical protein LQ338_006702 [Usnochroma carphineum]